MNAFSCAADMNGRVADEHGDSRDQFEIDERLDAEAADFLEVRVAGDANNENAEEQRRNDHLDEAQKDGAEELQINRNRRPVVTQLRAREKADENPSRQRALRSGIRGDEKDRQPPQEHWNKRGQGQQLSAGE